MTARDTPPHATDVALVVLAGGAARRMGGMDKTQLLFGGATLLDRAAHAAPRADPVVVVGPPREVSRPVRWVREDPVGGGPAAALGAGLQVVPPGRAVLVLAADLLRATELASALLSDPLESDLRVVLDTSGAPQWAACLLSPGVADAVRADPPPAGASLRATLGSWDHAGVAVDEFTALDVDTPDDLRLARRRQSASEDSTS